MRIVSWISTLQIGQFLSILVHLMQAALWRQGMYMASLSLSTHIIHNSSLAFPIAIGAPPPFYTWYCRLSFTSQMNVEELPTLKILLSRRGKSWLLVYSGDNRRHVPLVLLMSSITHLFSIRYSRAWVLDRCWSS